MATAAQQAAMTAIKSGDVAGALSQSTTINRFPDTPSIPTPSLPGAPTSASPSVGLATTPVGQANQQLNTGLNSGGQPLSTPQTQSLQNTVAPGSLRDFKKETSYNQKVGGPPQNPQETAQMIQGAYPPDVWQKDPELAAMVKAGIPSPTAGLVTPTLPQGAGGAAFDPAALKAEGYTDQQIQSLSASGNQANIMQGQLQNQAKINDATNKPTNSSLYLLEQALKAKTPIDDNQTDSLYAQAGIPTSGASAYAALANNLQQHSAELNQKYKSYSSLVGVTGSMLNDTYNAETTRYGKVLDAYKTSMDQYNHLQDQAFQTKGKMQDYENSLNLQRISMKSQGDMAQAARQWEYDHSPGQYIGADLSTGQSAGVFKNGTFTPLDSSSHIADTTGYGSGPTASMPVSTVDTGTLGHISGKYESGNDYGRVSSGVGDAGGVSYGAHQFSGGNIPAFVKNSGYSAQFAGMKPGSAAFTQKWQQLAKSDPAFNSAQDKYIAKTHYQPLVDKLAKSGFKDVTQRGQAVQEMIYSTGVQYGPGTTIINAALKGKDTSKMSDEQIISTVQNYKAETISSYFSRSSAAVQHGVKNRTMNEMKDLLALAGKTAQQTPLGQSWLGKGAAGIAQTAGKFVGGTPQPAKTTPAPSVAWWDKGNAPKAPQAKDQNEAMRVLQANSGYQEPQNPQMGAPAFLNPPIHPAAPAQQAPQQTPQMPMAQLQQHLTSGPVDEQGNPLNQQRLNMRGGFADAQTVNNTLAIWRAKAAQGLPGADQAYQQVLGDIAYSKQHPPLPPEQVKKYDQAYEILQSNINAKDKFGQQNLMGAIQTLTGEGGSGKDALEAVQPWGTNYIPLEKKAQLIKQAMDAYQLSTGKTLKPIKVTGISNKNGLMDEDSVMVGKNAQPDPKQFAPQLQQGEITVRDKQGNIGAIPANEFNPSLYTKL